MPRSLQLVLVAASLGAASPLAAAAPGTPDLLDRDRANGCALTISGAGRALLISASGLVPGESYHFTLFNGEMPPVDFAGYASGDGSLIRYYAPFRFGHPGGVVRVRVAASNCTMNVAAPWTRGVPVIR